METIAELLLAVVIVGTTLAFGGVQTLAFSLMETGIFLALFLLLLKKTHEGRINLPVPLWPVLFVLIVVFQVVPLPAWLVLRLSPARFMDAALASAPGSPVGWVPLSIYPHDTLLSLSRFLAYLSAFLLAACLFDSRKNRSILVTTLVLLGAFEAGYGIVQYVMDWHKIFTYENLFVTKEATGTYINRNHYAGFLELTLPLVVGMSFNHFQRWSDRSHHGLSGRASGGTGSDGSLSIFYLNVAVIMLLALGFSLSRGGILSAGAGILFISVLARLRTRRKGSALGLLLLLVGFSGYGLWIGLGPILARFEQVERPGFVKIEGRIGFWKDTLHILRDYPMTGTGLGTFGVAYPRYQTAAIGSFVAHTHNDYLEFASDVGVAVAGVLFLPIYWLLARMVISFLEDSQRFRRGVTLGCIGSVLMLLVHSFMDFNLQIPANALIFSVILGIGYKTACLERRPESAAAPGEFRPARHVVSE